MTRKEVISFMEKIKAYYQTFSMENYVINEWYDKLKDYDSGDVLNKLSEHLNGDYKNEVPKLHFITKYLKTPQEKARDEELKIRCMYCNEIIPFEENDKHLARHNSIIYIKSQEARIGKSLNEEKMMLASEEEFERLYKKFLEELYVVSQDQAEKERLEKIIFTYEL